MIKELEKHIQLNFPFLKDKKLLLTVSGGVDSVVLAYLMHRLNYKIGIAHCNFKLRETESDEDENFVKDFAQNNKIHFHSIEFNTKEYCKKNKISTQIGARTLRYDWFDQLAVEFKYEYILTAHHLNDVMETFFINLSRGTGIDGLTSIPPINNNIVRPLLIFSRKEIEHFAITNNIQWREDKSNAETKYLRNKIRHQIVPEFYQLNPQFEENFKKTIAHIYSSKIFITQKIEALKQDVFQEKDKQITTSKTSILALSDYEIYELFKPYNFHSPQEITKVLKAQTGKKIKSSTHTILSNRDTLIIYQNTDLKEDNFIIKTIDDFKNTPVKLDVSFSKKEINNHTIAIDLEGNPFPFSLRKRTDGDIFYPTGMTGKKKVNKYFKDQKLSELEKENTWLLCNSNNQVVWIVGHRADRTLTTKKNTKNTLYIQLIQAP